MNWRKITFSNEILVSGEAQLRIQSVKKMLSILPLIKMDDILICSRVKYGPGELIIYFSPEASKHLTEYLSAHSSVACETPKSDPDDGGGNLTFDFGNWDLLRNCS